MFWAMRANDFVILWLRILPSKAMTLTSHGEGVCEHFEDFPKKRQEVQVNLRSDDIFWYLLQVQKSDSRLIIRSLYLTNSLKSIPTQILPKLKKNWNFQVTTMQRPLVCGQNDCLSPFHWDFTCAAKNDQRPYKSPTPHGSTPEPESHDGVSGDRKFATKDACRSKLSILRCLVETFS